MSPGYRREMVDREHPSLPIVRQCALLGVSRSSLYYRAKAVSEENLSLIGEIDRRYLETHFYGSRKMKAWLDWQGIPVIRKRVRRLMRLMGLRAIKRRPPTGLRRNIGSIPTYWETPGPPGPVRCGPPTSPTCPCPVAFSTWWSSWTGRAVTWWPGDCPTLWKPAFAPKPLLGAGSR